jgi:hypothetical protein
MWIVALYQALMGCLCQEEAKNDGAVAGRGLSEVCYGAKYLSAKKKDPGAAILPGTDTSLPSMKSITFNRKSLPSSLQGQGA